MTKKQWSTTPKLLMRKSCIEYVTNNWQPGSFFEMGAGTGYLTSMFLNKGFHGECYDLGEDNRSILKANLAEFKDKIDVIEDLNLLNKSHYDYLFSFEVLEHINNDHDALKLWTSYLKPNGTILLSVPAHMKKFSAEDDAVGHIRRYEKHEIFSLLEKSGYEEIIILNYGFPLGNFTRFISQIIAKLSKPNHNLTAEEKSIKSGTQRPTAVNNLSFLFNSLTLPPFNLLQRLFFSRDWGDGYIIYAKKINE